MGGETGWTLLHFLWQGTAIVVLLAVVRRLMSDPRSRHLAACLALGLMVASPIATFGWLASGTAAPVQATANVAAMPSAAGIRTAVSTPIQSALPWLVMFWFAGVTAFSVRLVGGWISSARLRVSGTRPAPPEWQEALARLVGRMGVSRRVRLLVSAQVDAPAVLGWLRPVVLAPVAALTGLRPDHVEALLAHEVAHILRNDYLINLLQGLAEAVLFYHPAVWWVSRQIRAERELCCDDLAVAANGDVLTYAQALTELETCRPSRLSVAMSADGASLVRRIARLVEPSRPATHTMPGPGAAWALSVLLLLGIGAVAARGAQAPAGRGEHPTVDRTTIWIDAVKQGDVPIEVRGLGRLTSPTTVDLAIAGAQMKDVRVGQPVKVDFGRASHVASGRVTRIGPNARGGEVTVNVQVEAVPPEVAQPPAQVDGIIQVDTLTNVVYVGRPASGQTGREGTLFRLEPDGKQAVRVKVLFGRSSVSSIEVRSGLQSGDKVILSDTSPYNAAERINLK